MKDGALKLKGYDKESSDTVIDFGAGKKVIFHMKPVGFNTNDEKAELEEDAIRLLSMVDLKKGWSFVPDGTRYAILKKDGRNLEPLYVTSPEEVALCSIVFSKPQKTFQEEYIFKEMKAFYEKMKHCKMPGGDKIGRKVEGTARRINRKVMEKFNEEDLVIDYNGRLGLVGANKKFFSQ